MARASCGRQICAAAFPSFAPTDDGRATSRPADERALQAALADRYRIERELGAGGMATVYLAARPQARPQGRDQGAQARARRRARRRAVRRRDQDDGGAAASAHPAAVRFGRTRTGSCSTSCPTSRARRCATKLDRETQFGVDEAVRIAREVADALDYAHRHGVIHRDIKPENILLHDGRAMVADFGIALAVSAAAGGRMTETGLSLGTPHYMRPEQATAEKEITPRSRHLLARLRAVRDARRAAAARRRASAQQIIMKIMTEQARAGARSCGRAVPPNVAAARREGAGKASRRSVREREGVQRRAARIRRSWEPARPRRQWSRTGDALRSELRSSPARPSRCSGWRRQDGRGSERETTRSFRSCRSCSTCRAGTPISPASRCRPTAIVSRFPPATDCSSVTPDSAKTHFFRALKKASLRRSLPTANGSPFTRRDICGRLPSRAGRRSR